MHPQNRLTVFFGGLLLVLLAALLGLAWSLQHSHQRFLHGHFGLDQPMVLVIEPGSSFHHLPRQLSQLGLAQPHWHWRWLARIQAPVLKAGEYWVDPDSSVTSLMTQLAQGQVRRHRFTIVEGWTLAELRAQLATDSRLTALTRDWDEARLMRALGCEGCWAEGRFLPETYLFQRPYSDLELLRWAHEAMNQQLHSLWAQQRGDPSQKWLSGPDDLLILASLIEKEARLPAERREVAGVFVRRLERGMRLQTDPTVVYGITDPAFDGRIRRVHLQTDHVWNTYTRHGLPATAIALPGLASLEAAANPAPGRSLYFVARGDGSHHFSETLEEHNRAVNLYIRGRR